MESAINQKPNLFQYPAIVILVVCSILISALNLYEFMFNKLCCYKAESNLLLYYLMAIDLVAVMMPLFLSWKVYLRRPWARIVYLFLTIIFVLISISMILIFYVFSDNDMKSMPILSLINFVLYFIILISFAFRSSRSWFRLGV